MKVLVRIIQVVLILNGIYAAMSITVIPGLLTFGGNAASWLQSFGGDIATILVSGLIALLLQKYLERKFQAAPVASKRFVKIGLITVVSVILGTVILAGLWLFLAFNHAL